MPMDLVECMITAIASAFPIEIIRYIDSLRPFDPQELLYYVVTNDTNHHATALDYALSKGADINKGWNGSEPMLIELVGPSGDDHYTFADLLQRGASINVRTKDGRSLRQWLKDKRAHLCERELDTFLELNGRKREEDYAQLESKYKQMEAKMDKLMALLERTQLGDDAELPHKKPKALTAADDMVS